ncbi:arylacetamide deacetylase-like 4 [Heteronotia binoei]|uniref:arylacetamide deacetylase-like 4 n=1 Tax=Heteronotia binoei TaxID=13085 RepID=UPI00293057DC|nr:arylacetamide deacetylase-like 4 [Heteronotia binoei]
MQSLAVEIMDFLGLLLGTVATLVSLSAALILIWAAYYHWSNTEVPRGICRPLTLRLLHVLMLVVFEADEILWKVGLSNQFVFARLIIDLYGCLLFSDPKLTIKNVTVEGVPVRVYQPKTPQSLRRGIIHIHGGAGVTGSIDSYETISRYFANETDSVVFAVEYSLGPEHLYPLPFQQCLDITVHVLERAEDYGMDPARIIVCGDSFGALLTAATCQALGQRRDLPKLRAQILLCPALQMVTFNLPSYKQNSNVPILLQKQAIKFMLQYFKRNVLLTDLMLEGTHVPKGMKMKYKKWLSAEHIPEEFQRREAKVTTSTHPLGDIHKIIKTIAGPKLSPLLADDEIIQQLPEMFILTCQYDVLRDDGILYKKRLEENGVPVTWCHLVDGFHSVTYFINSWLFHFPCSKRGMDHVVNFIRSL